MKSEEYALEFATKWHKGQKRSDGKDYITHPIAVAEIAMELFREQWWENCAEYDLSDWETELYITAVLHDVVEDTDVTIEELEREFGYSVARDVQSLSRVKDETYFSFIQRLVDYGSIFALFVKLADLRHNMSDLKEGSLKDKYRFAEHAIVQELKVRFKN